MVQSKTDLPEYCQAYLKTLDPYVAFESGNVLKALSISKDKVEELLLLLTNEIKDLAYDEGKWTTIEVLGHLIDCERIFVYRALTISREINQPNLVGFEENDYARNSYVHLRNLQAVKKEFIAIMQSTQLFFEGLTEIELNKTGVTSGYTSTPRTIGMLISAHRLHHISIIKERYLSKS